MTLQYGDVEKIQNLTRKLSELVERLTTASEYDQAHDREIRDWLDLGSADQVEDFEPWARRQIEKLAYVVHEQGEQLAAYNSELNRQAGVLKGHWNVISSFQEHDQTQDAKLDELARELRGLRQRFDHAVAASARRNTEHQRRLAALEADVRRLITTELSGEATKQPGWPAGYTAGHEDGSKGGQGSR